MHSFSRENLLSVIYGFLLIISLQLLFLKISPNLYPLINTIPLLFLSQILRIDLFLFSLLISFTLFLFSFFVNFLDGTISLKVILNFFTVSTIVFFFSVLLNEKKNKNLKIKKLLLI